MSEKWTQWIPGGAPTETDYVAIWACKTLSIVTALHDWLIASYAEFNTAWRLCNSFLPWSVAALMSIIPPSKHLRDVTVTSVHLLSYQVIIVFNKPRCCCSCRRITPTHVMQVEAPGKRWLGNSLCRLIVLSRHLSCLCCGFLQASSCHPSMIWDFCFLRPFFMRFTRCGLSILLCHYGL